MLPLCSASLSGSSHYLASFQVGPRTLFPLHKSNGRCIVEDRVFIGTPNGIHSPEVSFKTQSMKILYADFVERSSQSGSRELADFSPNRNQFDDIICEFLNDCVDRESEKLSYSMREIDRPYPVSQDLNDLETPGVSGLDELIPSNAFDTDISYGLSTKSKVAEPFISGELQSVAGPAGDTLSDLPDQLSPRIDISESLSTADTGVVMDKASAASGTLEVTNDAISKLKENVDGFISGFNGSMDTSIGKADSALKNSYDSVTSLVTYAFRSAAESFESAVSGVLSSIDNTGEVAGNKLSGFTSEFKENTYKVGNVAIDVLRHTIVTVESSLAKAGSSVVYSYGSAKSLLPSDIQKVLNLSEVRVVEVLRPIGTAFQQVYVAVEGLEKYLGFDPNDPIVPFILLLGSSATLGISYWFFTYGGYSGDVTPKFTLDLLLNDENVALIDVRPEDLRERDGIPDLRRGARFRYASVTLPEMDSSVRKLLKNGRDVDDALVAAIIRNLKIVQDSSKVVVMDASGARSKGIARSLRKLGVRRPYLVQGGYGAWMKDGLRTKELKPETTLTILNEEAEAILEDILPNPLKVIGYGAGLIAGIYALIEWEKTLQFIGLIGLGQSIYRRVASYENSEDLKRDARLLLAPVKLGAQAFSWAAGKVEPNKIGLPTSPSSTAVQSRVLQAAAKHESQPSDTEETQDSPRESATPGNENLDLSEA